MTAAVLPITSEASATTAPRSPKRRRRPDILRGILAFWCGLVLVVLFVPIGLVVLHSFNRGGSFEVWSHHTTTRWWGILFDVHKAGPSLFQIVLITVIGGAIIAYVPRLFGLANRFGRQWGFPLAFAIGVAVVGHRTNNFHTVFRDKNVGDALRNSFVAAFGATIVAVIIGGLAGVGLARRPGWWTKPFMLTVFLLLVTPEIMDAIALAGWMQRFPAIFNKKFLGFDAGILRLWIGESLYSSAVVTLIVRARLAGIDESLEEAAGDLGAPPSRAFRQITLPMISSALVAGALLSFTICLDNTIIAEQVYTAGSSTFPIYLLSQLRSTVKPSVGAAAVVLFGITVASLGFVAVVLKRSGDSSSQIAATLAGG